MKCGTCATVEQGAAESRTTRSLIRSLDNASDKGGVALVPVDEYVTNKLHV